MADDGAVDVGVADEVPTEPPVALDHGVPVTSPRGERVLHPDRDRYPGLVAELGAEGFTQCVDVCGVDYLDHPDRSGLPPGVVPQRFEVVVNLIDHHRRHRVRLRVQVPADDPVVPSLFDLHPGTEVMEREAFDLFGITFDGHPDLSRILMPEGWVGHPLRKDYAVGQVPVQFKGAPEARA